MAWRDLSLVLIKGTVLVPFGCKSISTDLGQCRCKGDSIDTGIALDIWSAGNGDFWRLLPIDDDMSPVIIW
jgi:hypothetical protein